MISSAVYFSEIYREIDRAALNSPERDQGTRSSGTGMWLKEHGATLTDFDNSLKGLAPFLGARSIEVVHNDEAVFFCSEHSLIWYLQLIEDLISEHFPTVQKISFSLDYDPETSDKWVNADIEISGDVSQVIEWEDSFITEWVSQVPYPERDKIRLSCDIM
jgi:hypothetical protein